MQGRVVEAQPQHQELVVQFLLLQEQEALYLQPEQQEGLLPFLVEAEQRLHPQMVEGEIYLSTEEQVQAQVLMLVQQVALIP